MGIGVGRTSAEAIVMARIVEFVAIKVTLVEIEVATMPDAEARSTSEDQRQVGVAVTVPVGHAAAEQSHRGVKQRTAIKVLGLREAGEEIPELFDREGIALGERLHVIGIAVVMTELVARLRNAQLGNRQPLPFAAAAESGHAGGVGLKRKHNQIVHCPEILTRLGLWYVAVRTFAICRGNLRPRDIQPGIRAFRADFHLAHRSQILFQAALVFDADRLLQPAHFFEVGIENASHSAQRPPLSIGAVRGFFEEVREDLPATANRGEAGCRPQSKPETRPGSRFPANETACAARSLRPSADRSKWCCYPWGQASLPSARSSGSCDDAPDRLDGAGPLIGVITTPRCFSSGLSERENVKSSPGVVIW